VTLREALDAGSIEDVLDALAERDRDSDDLCEDDGEATAAILDVIALQPLQCGAVFGRSDIVGEA